MLGQPFPGVVVGLAPVVVQLDRGVAGLERVGLGEGVVGVDELAREAQPARAELPAVEHGVVAVGGLVAVEAQRCVLVGDDARPGVAP